MFTFVVVLLVASLATFVVSLATGAFFSRRTGVYLGLFGALCGLIPTMYAFEVGATGPAVMAVGLVVVNLALAVASLGGE